MANKPISSPLPANLPTTWIDSQIIAASGASVGLSEQHGYNYLMEQVNTAQSSINTINDAFADLATTEDINDLTAADVGADPTGTAAQAVSTHNASPNAHTSLFVAKQNKLTGKQGQVVGFDSQGNAQAQDPPGGGSGKRVCRFVVGTSTAGWTADDCDYLCDGTADDVEINAAIQALPSTGGEVVILDGTYNITATIAMNKNYVTLSGNGAATVLKRMWSGSGTGVITVTSDYCTVQNLQIDGNKPSYSPNFGIYLSGSSGNTITGNTCNNNGSAGIFLTGSSNNNTITGNTCNNNNIGISLTGNDNNTITGNTCNNNNNAGISLSSSNNHTITGNTCNNNNIGINLTGNSSNDTITGNTCNNNDTGIYMLNGNNDTITGNTCIRGNSFPSNYTSSQYTIQIASGSENNLIVGNNIMGKNYVDSGTNNTFANNKYQ